MIKPSKKLSLEERLSLAARKNKKRSKKASPSPVAVPITSAASSNNSENFEPEEEESYNKVEEKDETKDRISAGIFDASAPDTEVILLETTENTTATDQSSSGGQNKVEQGQNENLNSLISTAPWSFWLPKNTRVATVDELLNIIKSTIQSMSDEREELRNELAASKQRGASRETVASKEKDELISQLRSEGDKLAGTELRQNNTIKALKKKISGIEGDMGTLKDELSKKIRAFEKVSNSNEELQTLLHNHESHIKELRQENMHLKEVEKRLCEMEGEEYNLRSTLTTSRKDAELTAQALKVEIETLKAASQEQVTQLEATLEHLRIELDYQSKNTSSGTAPRSEEEDALRKELQSCKSSWSQLENIFNGKISDMETKIHELEQSRLQLNEQVESDKFLVRSLEGRLLEEQKEKGENNAKLQELQQESELLQKQLQDTNEDYKLLQKKFELQRLQLELNIGLSEKEGESIRSTNAPNSQKEGVMNSADIEEDWLSPPNVSQISSMESSMRFENSSLRKDVDDISNHPTIQDENDKLCANDIDIPDEAGALGASAQEAIITPQNTNSLNYQRRSTQLDTTGQMNAHILSKLGAEVRRYEAELNSLQNTCDRLQKEKSEASNEILKLLEENEGVQNLLREKDDLCQKLNKIQIKLDTTLQLLGEKTEQVEELENDVIDLKEMMQQQFQQIIEMQERLP